MFEFLTVVTPVFNNVKDIESCLKSVAQQTYSNKEHWIIDGGSTDGSLEIIKQYADNYAHLKWISEKDKGIYDAMNKGIERAKGDWLYFLGSDDQLINETIIEEVFSNSENLDNDLLYGNILLKEINMTFGKATDINGLKLGCTNHQATFIRSSVFKKLGKYNERYSICSDWAFTIKCFQAKELKIKYIDKLIAVYSTVGFSNTAKGDNLRLKDKNFNADFFGLFEHFSFIERFEFRSNDYLPVYLNPFIYISLLKRIKIKILKK